MENNVSVFECINDHQTTNDSESNKKKIINSSFCRKYEAIELDVLIQKATRGVSKGGVYGVQTPPFAW